MNRPKRSVSILSVRDLIWFSMCLILGITVFFLKSSVPVGEADLFIPIEHGSAPAGLMVTGMPVKGIEARVRGVKTLVESLPDLKLRYILDLSKADQGMNAISIHPEYIPFPKGVSVFRINPATVHVRMEKEIRKEVPVSVTLTGKSPPGYQVTAASGKPAAVILRGPERGLRDLERIPTKPIEIQGLSESFKKEIALDLPENFELIYPVCLVLAEISVEEKIATRKIENIRVEGRETAYAWRISPSVLQIEVKGPLNTLSKLQSEDGMRAYIDLKDLKPGVYLRPAALALPVKTMLLSVTPEFFTVKIDGDPRERRE